MRKKKSTQKKSFNKYGECGTIDLVYRVKGRGFKLVAMTAVSVMLTLMFCYSGGQAEAELDGRAKDVLISGVQVAALDTIAAEQKEAAAAAAAAAEEVKVSEEVKVLKEAREKSTEDVRESTTSVKKAYLTFDDGPSSNTDRILDILDEYNVKGNFFVIGRFSDSYKDQYKRIIDEGHVLGMHSYSHIYTEIYESADAFTADLNHVQYVIYDVTGYVPTIYRFPGGSSNLVSTVDMHEFIDILDKRGIVYYDWNVNSGDADTSLLGKEQIIDNVFTGIKALDSPEERNEVMILFHDLSQKTTTVEALPTVIEGLQAQGYVIAPIDDYTKLIQHPNVK